MEGTKYFWRLAKGGGGEPKQTGWNETFKTLLFKITKPFTDAWITWRFARRASEQKRKHLEPFTKHPLLPWNFLNWIFMFALRVFSSTHQSWAETPEEIRLIFVCRHKQSRLRSAAQMPQTESASVFEWTGHTSCVSCLAPPTPERVNSLRKWRVQTSGRVG